MIKIRGAKQNNLKNIDLDLPKNKLIVFTGVSGSGKSSLAFDTIFAEGQRRYVESLSSYARQFLGQLDKPDVDSIDGLSPAISIDQKSTNHNPRSTVGTVTEIYDYLRLLFGRAGEPFCPICDLPISPQTIDEICAQIMDFPDGTKFQLLAPIVRGKKGTHKQVLSSLASQGFVRVRIDGKITELVDTIELDKNYTHTIEVVVDRLVKKPDIYERLADSVRTSLRISTGLLLVNVLNYTWKANQLLKGKIVTKEVKSEQEQQEIDLIFSENFACVEHGAVMEELSPRLFSFNSPYGACRQCHGLGSLETFSPELIIPYPNAKVGEAIAPWQEKDNPYYPNLLNQLGEVYDFTLETPWNQLNKSVQKLILYGKKEPFLFTENERSSFKNFKGVIPMLEKNYRETNSDLIKDKLAQYMVQLPCEVCQGKRLKSESLSVRLGDHKITDLTGVSLSECLTKIENLSLSKRQQAIGELALKEIKNRLQFLLDVGLEYLTLDRSAMSLSGGEAQRIRLATQIGSGLTGVLYVLDEPSIGLHQRDNDRLLNTLKNLRDLGNTLIVVEHDEDTIKNADHIVDIGPNAGIHGGEIVVQGDVKNLLSSEISLTGLYLSGKKKIPTPESRRKGNGFSLILENCHHNNLKNITVEIPLGKLVGITGVSGSGKSTLVNELLYPSLQHHLTRKFPFPKKLGNIQGLESIDKVIIIDQSPIGRTPRSNPATYTGVFDIIRGVFAETIEAKTRGYKQGTFSFNVKGGRCEACNGQGVNIIEMNFLPDVYVQCEVCKGSRYNQETLQVKYKGFSITDVLNMTVEESFEVFKNIPRAASRLQTLVEVGLGYVKLGQSAPTLSGGEAQRLKLATELSKRATGKTIYLIDEPTTGLSFYDVDKLLNVLQRLVDKGNSILVIEHNLDVIRCCDWLLDLGPEGGDKGGNLVTQGTPEMVANDPNSYTGKYLKQLMINY
jgi:excinuclease ABC subunit A